jgi:preprotein translocase subunit SecA
MALEKSGGDKEHPDYLPRLAEFEAQCAKEREQVVTAGGLHILGTERHESRRIDNQLRGRAGRQGDPGSSQFFLSLEDDLLRIFGGDRITPWMERLGLEDGEAIEHKMISRAIENAQVKVEARNFDVRKHLLDYDDVMNKQRQAFYGRRRETLVREDLHDEVLEIIEGVLVAVLDNYWPAKGDPDEEALTQLRAAIEAQFGVGFDAGMAPFLEEGKPATDREGLGRTVFDQLCVVLEEKRKTCDQLAEEHAEVGYPPFEVFERSILLQILDRLWKDHLHSMDALREGIGLRGYAQRDPKIEYQREGFALFEEMSGRADGQFVETLFKFVLPDPVPEPARKSEPPPLAGPGPDRGALVGTSQQGLHRAEAKPGKVGRNDPCPCGSGKKYKKCHGL